jgi:cytochrome c oxidase assembly factor CtaG
MVFSLFGVLSVLLEVVRPFLPLIVLAVVVELVLVIGAFARHRKGPLDWRGARKIGTVAGVIAFIGAPSLAPWITGASHSQLAGWLDYTALVLIGLGAGAGVFVALLPPLLCFRTARR